MEASQRVERVTPLELFFDLVFVFAITQVTALISADLTWQGLARGMLVLAAIWWSWTGYAWLTNAIDPEAARIKGIKSEVAGRAQILVVPNLESGNMLAKNLSFLAKADAAGIVLGARVPIILTSRADSVRARMASCAAAVLYADARRRNAAVPAA